MRHLPTLLARFVSKMNPNSLSTLLPSHFVYFNSMFPTTPLTSASCWFGFKICLLVNNNKYRSGAECVSSRKALVSTRPLWRKPICSLNFYKMKFVIFFVFVMLAVAQAKYLMASAPLSESLQKNEIDGELI